MSVLIKGIEMPKNCHECCFCSGYMTGQARILGYVCLASLEKENSVRGRRKIEELCFLCIPDWCPLVEIPEKHGRLIDADKLMAIFSDRLERVVGRYGIDSSEAGILAGAMKLLESQTAIIKVEGAEECRQ